jgi:hypothetical protein
MKTEDIFFENYTPEYNQVLLKELQAKEDTGSTLPEDMCSWNGCMYETYGEELDYVIKQPSNRIWTIIEEDGVMYISAGYHIVNRLGYFITNEEITDFSEDYLIEE